MSFGLLFNQKYFERFKLFFLISVITVSAFISLIPANVFASSVYDAAVNVSSDLNMRWCPDSYWTNCQAVQQSPIPSAEKTSIWAMQQSCSSGLWDSFQVALKNGDWAIKQSNFATVGSTSASVTYIWTETHDTALFSGNNGYYGSGHYGLSVGGTMFGDWTPQWSVTVHGTLDETYSCTQNFANAVGYYPTNLTSDYEISNPKLWLSTFPVSSMPSGYAGAAIPDMVTDSDGDGLTAAQEYAQSTSDSSVDTDGDGLSDYTESIWNSNHDAIFCDTSTPKHCANPDPVKKDLYLQIDWLNNGSTSYEPTSTQLDLVEDKFTDIGIKFHADTGYFGGGNEISSNELPTTIPGDFYHHKYGNAYSVPAESASFDLDRYKVWHYMISGYNFDTGAIGDTTSSGKAEAGGDDTFLSYGVLETSFGGTSLNNAVAGTIIHELGHNICLSNTSYTGQNSSCLFSGIDNYSASPNYYSAMNYTYQFDNSYSYSDGTHGSGDHNDLSALPSGLNDFLEDDDSSVGGPI